MNQQTTQQVKSSPGGNEQRFRAQARAANPRELARRELVEWCERRGLPVPLEHRDPR